MKKKSSDKDLPWLILQLFFCTIVLLYLSVQIDKPFKKYDKVECVNLK